MTPRTPSAALLLLLCVALALGSCARIPDDGPLVEGDTPEVPSVAAPFDFAPPGPDRGATPEQVVSGFLTALQATPLTTTVARQFLTDRAAEDWQPERRTLLYGEQDVQTPPVQARREPVRVSVSVRRVFALDHTGRWSGRQRDIERTGLQLSLVREGGEWRVADPPDALVLPLSHFENRYRRFALHFADPTGSLLVPEPVYFPMETQTPTQLVNSVLAGPKGPERAVDRTYLPSGTELVLSVPVTADGVAQVPLTADILDLAPRELVVAAAQLVWTLRQVPEVVAVRITADGEPVSVPGIGEVVPVDALPEFSPVVASATTDLYGLRRGTVQRVVDGRETRFLRLPAGMRGEQLGVSLLGNPVAVTDGTGRVHVLARGSAQQRPVRPVETLENGPVTRPIWDWSRALWLVPRRFDGTVQVLVGGRMRSLPWRAPALAGRRVQSAALSRDGSRLVIAVSRPGGGTDLRLARVMRSSEANGSPVALRPSGAVSTGLRLPAVLDIGWRGPLTLAVLVRTDRLRSRVLTVPIDGQRESGALAGDSDLLFGRAVAMAASPASDEVRVTTEQGDVYVLTSLGRWRSEVQGDQPLRAPTYAG